MAPNETLTLHFEGDLAVVVHPTLATSPASHGKGASVRDWSNRGPRPSSRKPQTPWPDVSQDIPDSPNPQLKIQRRCRSFQHMSPGLIATRQIAET